MARRLLVSGYMLCCPRSLSLDPGLIPIAVPPVHSSLILPAVPSYFPVHLASSRIARVFDGDKRATF